MVASYSLSYIYGHLEYPNYYFSSAINHYPAHNIGIFGVFLGCVTWTPVTFWHYQFLKLRMLQLKQSDTALSSVNDVALLLAVAANIGGAGVVAVPLNVLQPLHYFFALAFFLPQLLYLYIQVQFLDHLANFPPALLSRRRRSLQAACGAGVACMLAGATNYVALSSFLELVIIGCFLHLAASFCFTLSQLDRADPPARLHKVMSASQLLKVFREAQMALNKGERPC